MSRALAVYCDAHLSKSQEDVLVALLGLGRPRTKPLGQSREYRFEMRPGGPSFRELEARVRKAFGRCLSLVLVE